MAFHVACPITCRKICYCSLGFPRELQIDKGKNGFLEEIAKVKAFLNDPWRSKDGQKTVQVLVPKVAVAPPPPPPIVTVNDAVVDGKGGDASEEMVSAQNKRAAMQKKAAATSLEAEDYARRFESGDLGETTKDLAGDEQNLSNSKVMCRLCFSGENERSERARKMLSCKSCNKKYHRSCLKSWAHNRDLFHWSSWTCPSCRTCEVCRRTGDPNKLMFCKRCDAAYHCYCQQPPHKNVSKGPYLCPKHTRCHSCSSTVPGNGLSLRWFLGHTCCDACGRLFVKGNYCPVCLKVYRDSESTPMVCCDICQRWVHCHCDGISDEKYLQFQVDNNLQYTCATCRGECYQVRDLEDAVQELWRRRDKADQKLIASLRAAAGLPTQEEIFSISPSSDEEDDGPAFKSDYGHSLRFSLKGVVDKSPKKSKGSTKKSTNKNYGKKKGFPTPIFSRIEPRVEGQSDAQSIGSITGDNKEEDVQSRRSGEPEMFLVPKQKFVNEIPVKTERKVNSYRVNEPGIVGDGGKHVEKSKNTKGTKLVIHLGGRNKNLANSPRSDASNEQILTTSNGSEDAGQQRAHDKHLDVHETTSKLVDVKVESIDQTDRTKGLKLRRKEGNLITIKKPNPENSVSHSSQKDTKPPLRLKFKNLYSDSQSSWAPPGEEDKGLVKGQRSKRKRPEKSSSIKEDHRGGPSSADKSMMDTKWIIQKLGKNAVGKLVEVHQPSTNSWQNGTISEVFVEVCHVSVTSDDGKAIYVDPDKLRMRFVSQKQRQ